jgi:hypothetical protein
MTGRSVGITPAHSGTFLDQGDKYRLYDKYLKEHIHMLASIHGHRFYCSCRFVFSFLGGFGGNRVVRSAGLLAPRVLSWMEQRTLRRTPRHNKSDQICQPVSNLSVSTARDPTRHPWASPVPKWQRTLDGERMQSDSRKSDVARGCHVNLFPNKREGY